LVAQSFVETKLVTLSALRPELFAKSLDPTIARTTTRVMVGERIRRTCAHWGNVLIHLGEALLRMDAKILASGDLAHHFAKHCQVIRLRP
jgi:hypothetical protein